MPKKAPVVPPAVSVSPIASVNFIQGTVLPEMPGSVHTSETPFEIVDEEEFGTKVEVPWIPSRVTPENFLSTGITILNLALTNSVDCGVEKGTMTWLRGSSSAGKTLVALLLCAEAANNPHFDNYDILYADVEGGVQFDIRALFGNKLANRLTFVFMSNGEPFRTVEDFYAFADKRQRDPKPFILIVDSMDALGTTPEAERFDKNIAEREKNLEKGEGKEYVGISPGFGDGKAKINSAGLRRLRNRLPVNGSMFICLSQESVDITTGYKTVSGGSALRFFADVALWLAKGGDIKCTWQGKERVYGQYSQFKIDKNRISGMKTKIQFPILLGAGICDTDACIDWLAEEGVFKLPKVPAIQSWEGTLPDGSEFKLTREKLVRYFEDNPDVMKELMKCRWYDILEHIVPKRKKRYE